MLTTLRIKNLALVSDLTLELQPGCNVVTGETGAGKSIIIGALNLVLGERADRSLIRSGEESCSVEAVFDVKRLRAPLKSFLERPASNRAKKTSLSSSARSPAREPTASLSTARRPRLPRLRVSANGSWTCTAPHDHQSLLHSSKQLPILDAFGGLDKEREMFGELVRHRAVLGKRKIHADRG